MKTKLIRLEILTPDKKYFDNEVEFFSLKSDKYSLGISFGHSNLITSISICKLTIRMNDIEFYYALGGGMLNINNNVAILLVDSIERADEIDLDRAINDKLKAEKSLNENKSTIDKKRALKSLAKARNRIKVLDNMK